MIHVGPPKSKRFQSAYEMTVRACQHLEPVAKKLKRAVEERNVELLKAAPPEIKAASKPMQRAFAALVG